MLESVGQLRSRPGTWQLEQGKWVAAGLGDDPSSDAGIQGPLDHRVQQLAGVGVAEAIDRELWQAQEVALIVGFRQCDGQNDPFCHQPAGHEGNRLR